MVILQKRIKRGCRYLSHDSYYDIDSMDERNGHRLLKNGNVYRMEIRELIPSKWLNVVVLRLRIERGRRYYCVICNMVEQVVFVEMLD